MCGIGRYVGHCHDFVVRLEANHRNATVWIRCIGDQFKTGAGDDRTVCGGRQPAYRRCLVGAWGRVLIIVTPTVRGRGHVRRIGAIAAVQWCFPANWLVDPDIPCVGALQPKEDIKTRDVFPFPKNAHADVSGRHSTRRCWFRHHCPSVAGQHRGRQHTPDLAIATPYEKALAHRIVVHRTVVYESADVAEPGDKVGDRVGDGHLAVVVCRPGCGQVPVKERRSVGAGAQHDVGDGVVSAGGLTRRSGPVSAHLGPLIRPRIIQRGDFIAIQRQCSAAGAGADEHDVVLVVVLAVGGATVDMRTWQGAARKMFVDVAVLPHLPALYFCIGGHSLHM